MSEFESEPRPVRPPRKRATGVAIATIVAITVVILACIAATTLIAYVFLLNPPW